MTKKTIEVGLERGLDPRSVAELIQIASTHESTVDMEVDNKKINAKSLMGMMGLLLKKGETAVVIADGKDEEEAISAIEQYVSGRT